MSGDWLVLSAPAPSAREAHLLVDALRRVGARAVERSGDRVLALFPPTDDVDGLVAAARTAIRASTAVRNPELSWRRQGQAEWAARWRREQTPRREGRIVVTPGGSAGEAGEDDVVLRLDPGVAFGTGEHPTTRACLRLLDRRVRPGDRVLDLGAGSGILAVAAVLLGAGKALALEADPLACEVARRNVALNGVGDRVRVRELDVRPRSLRRLGRHDVVAANLQTGTLLPLLPAAPMAMRRGGALILSGVVGDERNDILAASGDAGLELVKAVREGGWWTGLLTRPV